MLEVFTHLRHVHSFMVCTECLPMCQYLSACQLQTDQSWTFKVRGCVHCSAKAASVLSQTAGRRSPKCRVIILSNAIAQCTGRTSKSSTSHRSCHAAKCGAKKELSGRQNSSQLPQLVVHAVYTQLYAVFAHHWPGLRAVQLPVVDLRGDLVCC
jgi:hypothetical protein